MNEKTRALQAFIDDVDAKRQQTSPEVPYQPVPKDLLYAARDHIHNYLRGIRSGGTRSRGHRYQNVPDSAKSQTPRAIRARETRKREKQRAAGLIPPAGPGWPDKTKFGKGRDPVTKKRLR